MSIDLKEFFMDLSLSGFFENIPYLGAISILSNNDISYYELDALKSNTCIYIKNVRNYGDLILGEKYDVAFTMNNPKDYQKTDVEVDYLTLKKGDNIGIMPDGRGGIVGLKFNGKVSEMTKLLKQSDDEQFDKNKHSFIYFTTHEVMDKILKELDKQQDQSS